MDDDSNVVRVARRLAAEYAGTVLAGVLGELDAARARIAELEAELAAAMSTIAVWEDPELRVSLTSPSSGDYGPAPHPDAAPDVAETGGEA